MHLKLIGRIVNPTKQQTRIKMNQLERYLKKTHTVAGSISFDNDLVEMIETVEQFETHKSTEVDCLINQLLESDYMQQLARSLVRGQTAEGVLLMMRLEEQAEKNLEELVVNQIQSI